MPNDYINSNDVSKLARQERLRRAAFGYAATQNSIAWLEQSAQVGGRAFINGGEEADESGPRPTPPSALNDSGRKLQSRYSP